MRGDGRDGAGERARPFFSNFWASALLREVGGSDRANALLEGIASGEKKATVAWLEAGSSWSPAAIRLSVPESGNIQLTGKKRMVTDAAAADVILVVVKRGKGFAVVPVASDARGLRTESASSMDQTRPLFDVTLEGYRSRQEIFSPFQMSRLSSEPTISPASLFVPSWSV